ncbi:MAG TPA: exodeoxyribonuclease I [Rudaea sp.]
MNQPSFYWHDYETFGTDPRRDRPAQFAGQRTTMDLEPIGEPLTLYCKPAPDVLPSPVACLVTGITPQLAERDGVIEAEFAARIHEELAQPGTCGAGYNTLRFDDEFTRNLLYRNFYDPFAREWENGNSRWDIIDLARMAYALRPHGIEWPRRDDGSVSFRLEDLAKANHLAHERAHDAQSDVQATIALAKLLRVRQPRLFDFYFALRRKQRAFELLDFVHRTPVLHVSSRYPAERGCLALVVPLAQHPSRPNDIIVYDLSADPTALIELDADAIAARVFTSRADLPEGIERIPLKTVHANKSPALAPLSALAGVDRGRIGLDVERCMEHLRRLDGFDGLPDKLRCVFETPERAGGEVDVDIAIYDGGFLCDADRRLLRDIRSSLPEELGRRVFPFRDVRCNEMLFRYRARNWPQTLSGEETQRWLEWCAQRLADPGNPGARTLDAYFNELHELMRTENRNAGETSTLGALEAWGLARRADLSRKASVAQGEAAAARG